MEERFLIRPAAPGDVDELLRLIRDLAEYEKLAHMAVGTPAQMVESLAKLARLPAATRVYCGHEYTMANIRFAQAVEPGNGALDERKEREAAKLLRGEATLPSTIAEELATNPFLRCGEREVIASAEKHAGRKLSSAVDVFAEIRAWKNAF